ncbi:MAG: ribosomal protein [Frankiales bacterium]|nr:ribosomal protein [Frankiales bacterium]
MSEVRIVAEPRTEFGKGAARRVRRAHKVPAVLYGHGDAPRHFSLPGHELLLALRNDPNVLLTLQTDEGEQLALPKVVVRDPIKRTLEHIDLVAVRRGEKVTVDIAVTLVGETTSAVLVDFQMTTLSVEADATQLPDGVEVNIDGLTVGTQITAGDVQLPPGTTLIAAPEAVVVQGLAAPSAADVEADIAASDEETGAGQLTVDPEAETQASDTAAGAGTGDGVPETGGPKGSTSAGNA